MQGPAETSTLRGTLAFAARQGVFRRALVVALVVGTVLNLINQGDRLLSGQGPDWLKLALTYLVPFVVSSHGALTVLLKAQKRPS